MPSNMSTGDPIPIGTTEWAKYRFRELNDEDLFWFKNVISEENGPHRKINDTEALNLREQQVILVRSDIFVYQKEY